MKSSDMFGYDSKAKFSNNYRPKTATSYYSALRDINHK